MKKLIINVLLTILFIIAIAVITWPLNPIKLRKDINRLEKQIGEIHDNFSGSQDIITDNK